MSRSTILVVEKDAFYSSFYEKLLTREGYRVVHAESIEEGLTGYIVAWGPPEAPTRNTMRVIKPAATITGATPGMVVSVKAVNARGLEGWDWARGVIK